MDSIRREQSYQQQLAKMQEDLARAQRGSPSPPPNAYSPRPGMFFYATYVHTYIRLRTLSRYERTLLLAPPSGAY